VPRRYITTLLAIALLASAALTVQASDFWISRDWKQWSKGECGVLLAESPWTHTWRPGPEIKRSDTNPGATAGTINPEDQLSYVVQLRSSLPVRQALIRQQQLDQNYDKMSADERAAFDTRAAQILDRNYGDTILVHVDFSSIGASIPLKRQIVGLAQKPESLRALLVAEDGFKLDASHVNLTPSDATFDITFPRAVEGAPVIKGGQKRFAIQFQNPANQPVRVEFDLSKMLVNGKPSY
jgi:hypothetical protein